jgi:hypothetical protein
MEGKHGMKGRHERQLALQVRVERQHTRRVEREATLLYKLGVTWKRDRQTFTERRQNKIQGAGGELRPFRIAVLISIVR